LGKSRLLFVDKPNDKRDRLLWRWGKGAHTLASEFGNPSTTTDYALCVFDEIDETPMLVSETIIPAGSSWTPIASGYRYRDKTRANHGVQRVLLKAGPEGRARIVVRGKGDKVPLPELPLQQDQSVRVQLLNESACWEATYGTFQVNEAERFKARSD
jgi:hypothetical protein